MLLFSLSFASKDTCNAAGSLDGDYYNPPPMTNRVARNVYHTLSESPTSVPAGRVKREQYAEGARPEIYKNNISRAACGNGRGRTHGGRRKDINYLALLAPAT